MTFIDTGAFLARYLPNDQHHRVATALWNKIRTTHEHCLTSNFVLDETITLLARRASYLFAAEKARLIYASSALEILRPDSSAELAALDWFEKFADQKVSFTDCQGRSHAGLILAQQQRYPVGDQMRRLLRLVAAKSAEQMRNRIEFLSAWS